MSRLRAAEVEVEDVVDGRYVVERMLGQGSLGNVYSGRHCQLGQRVAIKFLRPELAQRFEMAEAFRRQARSMAAIQAEHVCSILDVGTLDNGIPYVVMEYLEGRDLQQELAVQVGGRHPEEAVDWVLQACDALASVLVAGIVHRDLRPSKLFLAVQPDGSRHLKLLDAGSSGLADTEIYRGRSGLLDAGLPRCVQYLAPEQLVSPELADPRCNVWALGAMLHQLLCGAPPYRAETPEQLGSLQRTAAPALSRLGLQLPDGLSEVVGCALERTASARYASLSELAGALAPYAPERSLASLVRISRLLPPRAAAPSRSSARSLRGGATTTRPGLPSALTLSAVSRVAGTSRPSDPLALRQAQVSTAGGRGVERLRAGLLVGLFAAVLAGVSLYAWRGHVTRPAGSRSLQIPAPRPSEPRPEASTAPAPPANSATPVAQPPPPSAVDEPPESTPPAPSPSPRVWVPRAKPPPDPKPGPSKLVFPDYGGRR